MVRPQQAADSDGAAEPAEPALVAPPAAANGECRLHGSAAAAGRLAEAPAAPPPAPPPPLFTTVAPPPPASDGVTRYTPSPHSQGSASPPQGGAASPHVVLLHIVDGESIQFQRGDNIELIQGKRRERAAAAPLALPRHVCSHGRTVVVPNRLELSYSGNKALPPVVVAEPRRRIPCLHEKICC